MGYSKQTWTDGPAGATPLSAARLSKMEDGIAAAAVLAEVGDPATATGAALKVAFVPVVPWPGTGVDAGPALQAALDAYRIVQLQPGKSYLIGTPVFLDAANNSAKYAIYCNGAELLLSENLPVPSTWNVGIGNAPPTAFFNGTQRTALSGGVVDTGATGGACNAPAGARLTVHDFVATGNGALGAQAACLVFGGTSTNNINGAGASLVNGTLNRIIAGLSWSGYADMNSVEGVDVGANPAGRGSRIIYQRSSGDGTRVIRCKAYGGYIADLASSNGFKIESCIGGQINIGTSTGEIAAGHQETDELASAVPWSINIDRSRVTILDHYTWASNVATKYSIRVQDAGPDPVYVASEVTIRDWRPVSRFSSASTDVTKGPALYIAALNKSGRVRVENTRGVVIVSGVSVGWQALHVGAGDTDIATALTAGADYIATGNFELAHRGGWQVRSPFGTPPSTRPLTVPTVSAAAHGTATGTLAAATIYEYVAAAKTADGSYSVLSATSSVAAGAKGAIDLTVLNSMGACTVALWRKAGAGVTATPDAYIEVGLNAPETLWLDLGANLNGRAWQTTGIPVPTAVAGTGPQFVFPAVATGLLARKTADEVVNNNATLQDDDHLFLILAANAVYDFELHAVYDASTVADAKFAFAVPAGSELSFSQSGAATAAAGNSGSISYAAGATSGTQAGNVGGAGVGALLGYRAQGLVSTGSTAGRLQVRWAQGTADATDTTVRKNSYLIARRVA